MDKDKIIFSINQQKLYFFSIIGIFKKNVCKYRKKTLRLLLNF